MGCCMAGAWLGAWVSGGAWLGDVVVVLGGGVIACVYYLDW